MPQTTTCPNCGSSATGNFCSSCGAALGGRHCTQCGSSLVPGARFCNECGAPVGAGRDTSPAPPPRSAPTAGAARASAPSAGAARGAQAATGSSGGSSHLGWWAAGAMMVLVIAILALPILRPEEPATPAVGPGGVPPATTDISNMSPMEAATRLYDRVMQAASNNDSTQVQMFLPMAIDAHELARPLTADAAFHLSSLQRMAVRNEEALATAQEALAENPDHLLLLYAGGEAALALGRNDVAAEYADRMMEAWDRELGMGRAEYDQHTRMMSDIRAFAEANAGGG